MIRSTLNIYKKNIWDTFALIGFVAIGVTIGLFVIIPTINSLINTTYYKLVSEATRVFPEVNADKFFSELVNAVNKKDWSNPIRTFKELFENHGLLNIIIQSFKTAGLDLSDPIYAKALSNIIVINNNFINSVRFQITIFFVVIGAVTIIGYLLTKIMIQMRSTKSNNILRFILLYILNAISISVIYLLVSLCLVNLNGVGLIFALIGVSLLLLILSFASALLCYKTKEIKLSNIVTLKNILFLFLSVLIVHAISISVFAIIFIFSDIFAFIISLPLFLITTIIIENIVSSYITDFKNKEIITNNNQKV